MATSIFIRQARTNKAKAAKIFNVAESNKLGREGRHLTYKINCWTKMGKSSTIPSVFSPQAHKRKSNLPTITHLRTFTKVIDQKFSKTREYALLEDHVLSYIHENVRDPILQIPLRDLKWLRGPNIHEHSNTIEIILRLSSKLHPKLNVLIENLKICTKEAVRDFYVKQTKKSSLKQAVWDVDVQVQLTSPKIKAVYGENLQEREKTLGPGLVNVSNFVAVYSCKGGVGKSTVAANIAYSLAKRGGRIGLLDVDVYGPSLPVLIKPTDPAVRKSDIGKGMVLPILHEGVKLLSLGFVSPKSGVPGSGPESSGAAVMRGPMASRVVAQLLKGTEWGELDILILDMPPGTGDVQLTICQDLNLNGLVCVSTPSKLAITDAEKGIEMFDSLGVPTIAFVENMAYFECEGGGKHFPFGQGKGSQSFSYNSSMSANRNHPPIFQLPISELTNSSNDAGTPITLSRPPLAHNELLTFDSLSDCIAESLLLQEYDLYQLNGMDGSTAIESSLHASIDINGQKFSLSSLRLTADIVNEKFIVRLYSETGAIELEVNGEDLRMTHPKTGKRLQNLPSSIESTKMRSKGCGDHTNAHKLDERAIEGIAQIEKDQGQVKKLRERKEGRPLFPVTIEKRGYYGYSVQWADGATIIYSISSIANVATNSLSRFQSFFG